MTDEPQPHILKSDAPKKDYNPSDVIGQFIEIMREIKNQEPLDDPNVIFIDKDGTRYY